MKIQRLTVSVNNYCRQQNSHRYKQNVGGWSTLYNFLFNVTSSNYNIVFSLLWKMSLLLNDFEEFVVIQVSFTFTAEVRLRSRSRRLRYGLALAELSVFMFCFKFCCILIYLCYNFHVIMSKHPQDVHACFASFYYLVVCFNLP